MKKNLFLLVAGLMVLLLSYTGHAQNKIVQTSVSNLPPGTSINKEGTRVTILAGYSTQTNPDGSVSVVNTTTRSVVGSFRCDGCKENEEGTCNILVDSEGRTISCNGSCSCRLLVKVKEPVSGGTKAGTKPGVKPAAIEWTPVKTQ